MLTFSHRFEEGLERSEAALAFWQEKGLPSTSYVFWLQESIGNAASSLGDNARGEKAYRDALQLAEKLNDKPNGNTAWITGLLGSFLLTQDRLEEADPLLRQGLKSRIALFGESDPTSIFAMNALARLRSRQGRSTEAMTMADRAVAACRSQESEVTACAKSFGLRAHLRAGDESNLELAKRDLERAFQIQSAIQGNEGPIMGALRATEVEILEREGRYSEALIASEEALSVLERAGGGHWQTLIQIHYWRAKALFGLERMEEALNEVASLDVQPEDPLLGFEVASLHAHVLSSMGRKKDAAAVARTALKLGEKRHDVAAEFLEEIRDLVR
jgi:tetratricopeptide (TPR) repeat protein